jgi:hypothetical protein
MTGAAAPTISDEERGELLELIEGSDSVELKMTIPEAQQRSAIAALGMDGLEGRIRHVFFFDTPDLRLYESGLVVRARRTQVKGDDSVVKLRPVVPAELPSELRESASFNVEVDAIPGGFVCSGSMKGKLKTGAVQEAIRGERPLHKLYSKEQRKLFAEHRPDGLELDDLSILGPLFVLKLKFSPEGFGRKLVAEVWIYPDYSQVLELSTKCAPSEAFQVAAEMRAYVASRGVDFSGKQQTKTRKALKFLSRQLKADRD